MPSREGDQDCQGGHCWAGRSFGMRGVEKLRVLQFGHALIIV